MKVFSGNGGPNLAAHVGVLVEYAGVDVCVYVCEGRMRDCVCARACVRTCGRVPRAIPRRCLHDSLCSAQVTGTIRASACLRHFHKAEHTDEVQALPDKCPTIDTLLTCISASCKSAKLTGSSESATSVLPPLLLGRRITGGLPRSMITSTSCNSERVHGAEGRE